MSKSDYDLLGGMATTASTFGAASFAMFGESQTSASAAGVGRVPPTDLRKNLAADAFELKRILTDAGYDRSTINRQLEELIRQNEATGNFIKK